MRKVSLITIAVVFELALSITSCETTITTSQNAAKNTQKAIDDANRQDGIKEDYNRDNFDFNQFDTIQWSDPKTYGEHCSGMCIGPIIGPISADAAIPEIGLTSENYYAVGVKGDGSCWLRSAIHALIFHAFNDQKIFDHIVSAIGAASIKYATVPGFDGRFRAGQLSELLNTLKNLSPKERLTQFNKKKVDLFLDYSMRALLHAQSANSSNFKLMEKYLRSHSWGDQYFAFSNLHHALLSDSGFNYANLRYSPEFKRNILNPNIWVIGEVENFLRPWEHCFYNNAGRHNDPHLLKSHCINEETNDLRKSALLKITITSEDVEFFKSTMNTWRVTHLSKLHKLSWMRIFPYAQSTSHAALIIHKSTTKLFGLQ